MPDSGSPGNQVDKVIAASASALAGARLVACWCVGAYDGTTRSVYKFDLAKVDVSRVLVGNFGNGLGILYGGHVTENEFDISVWHDGIQNPCSPVLFGRIEKDGDGCRVTTHFDIAPSSKVFLSKVLCAPIVLGSILLMCFDWNPLTVLAFCFPLFVIPLIRLGKFLGKADEAKLLLLMDRVSEPDAAYHYLPRARE